MHCGVHKGMKMNRISNLVRTVVTTLLLLGGVSTVNAQVFGTAPQTFWRETDQTLPLGMWHVQVKNDQFVIEKNTASNGAFGTTTSIMAATGNFIEFGAIPFTDITINTAFHRLGIGGAPTQTLDVFGSGLVSAQFRGTGATGSYIQLYDSTNSTLRGYLGYGPVLGFSGITDFGITSVGPMQLATGGGTVAITVDTSQHITTSSNLTVNGLVGIGGIPTTGQLDVFGSGQISANFRGTGATGSLINFYDSTNTVSRGTLGYGAYNVTGAAITDFGLASQDAIVLATGASATRALTIDTSQRVGIGGAPVSGYDLTLDGIGTFDISPATGANRSFITVENTGGNSTFGTESSTGANLFTGSTAYATVLGSAVNRVVELFTNNTLAVRFNTSQQTLHTDGTAGAPSVSSITYSTTGLRFTAGPSMRVVANGIDTAYFDSNTFLMSSNVVLAWNSATNLGGTVDTVLVRDAANVLALKNSTAAQEFRVYGTTTGPKYVSLLHTGIFASISPNDDSQLRLTTNSGNGWLLYNSSQNYAFSPLTDNGVDLGLSAARVRSIYAGTSVTVGAGTGTALLSVATGHTYLGSLATSSSNQTGDLCINTSTHEVFQDTVVGGCVTSSNVFKDDVSPIASALNLVLQIVPVDFRRKDPAFASHDPNNPKEVGLIAEQVATVDPRLVGYTSDGRPLKVNYEGYTAFLTRAIQEQNIEIELLRSRVQALETK